MISKPKLLVVAVFAVISLVTACGHDNSPNGVADEFLFRYFIELNQRGALALSTGLAEQKLNKEIELLQSVRMEPNLDLSKHKPFIDYKLVNKQERGTDSATLYYDVTVQGKDGGKVIRQQVVSVTKIAGEWKVNNFDTYSKESR